MFKVYTLCLYFIRFVYLQDSDIIGTYGWDILCKRMKEGKKVCNDVAHYLKDRYMYSP